MNYDFAKFAQASDMDECFLGYMYCALPVSGNEQVTRVGVYSGDMMAARIRDKQHISLDCAQAIVVMMEANHFFSKHAFRVVWSSKQPMICVSGPDDSSWSND